MYKLVPPFSTISCLDNSNSELFDKSADLNKPKIIFWEALVQAGPD